MPGRGRNIELQFTRQRRSDLQALVSKSSQRADGAAKLRDQQALSHFCEALTMAVDRIEPTSYLQPESCRQRMLHQGAASNRRGTVLSGQLNQSTRERVKVCLQNAERIPNLKNESSVVDVLTRRAPMNEARRLVVVFQDERGELFDQRNCRVERQCRRGRQGGY